MEKTLKLFSELQTLCRDWRELVRRMDSTAIQNTQMGMPYVISRQIPITRQLGCMASGLAFMRTQKLSLKFGSCPR